MIVINVEVPIVKRYAVTRSKCGEFLAMGGVINEYWPFFNPGSPHNQLYLSASPVWRLKEKSKEHKSNEL